MGQYRVTAVVDGAMRDVAICGPDISNLTLTTWASQNWWIVQENRIMAIS